MKTIALRYAENFAPNIGTIGAHQQVIDTIGYVWYGKLGNPVSEKIATEILQAPDSVILLIHSGGQDRYWAHVEAIQRNTPSEGVPRYYQNMTDKFKCWFKVTEFEKAAKDVMCQCFVASSKKPLSLASRHSMSPYFIIEYQGEKPDEF